MTHKEELHILIIGLDRSGKTTLLERLKSLYTAYSGLDLPQILPTVGLNIARFSVRNVPLVFWDLGGQAQLRSIWEKYYAESHAVLYMIDAADGDRVAESKRVLDRTLGKMNVELTIVRMRLFLW
jgi:ADP-ribosylation factor related protein 1